MKNYISKCKQAVVNVPIYVGVDERQILDFQLILVIFQVLSITTQIPQLKFLNLSSNPLSRDLPPELTPITSLVTITSLVLNNTKIPWQTLHTVLDSTPT